MGIEQMFEEAMFPNHMFAFAVQDIVRCSLEFKSAQPLVSFVRWMDQGYGPTSVLELKNGFRRGAFVPKSGYRHVSAVLKLSYLKLENWPQSPNEKDAGPGPVAGFIGEVQLVLSRWLANKKYTSTYYKIRRAESLNELAKEMRKYMRNKKRNSRNSYYTTGL